MAEIKIFISSVQAEFSSERTNFLPSEVKCAQFYGTSKPLAPRCRCRPDVLRTNPHPWREHQHGAILRPRSGAIDIQINRHTGGATAPELSEVEGCSPILPLVANKKQQ